MIELAPEEYWRTDLNWYEAKFYCFCLNIDGTTGWHLPDMDYFHANQITSAINDWFWTSEDLGSDAMQVRPYGIHFIEWGKTESEAVTMPVRDLKDD